MRILRVADVPRSDAAGVSGAILRSGAALTDLGHEVDYLFAEDLLTLHLRPALRHLVIPAVVCLRVVQRVRRSPVDVVDIHRPVASVYAPLARSKLLGRRLPPCLVQSHGLEELWWKTMRVCWARAGIRTTRRHLAVYRILLAHARIASRYAAAVVVLTETDARHLVDVLGVAESRVHVAHNGVEPALLDLYREPAPPALRVLFFGSWLDRKGALEMAAAWPLVRERCPASSLTVAGSGLAGDEVLKSFDPSCSGSVEVRPHVPRSDVPDLLAAHDVLVLPSWYEGMPLAVLEAAAAGMAIVTTRIAGATEVFRPPHPEDDGAILVDVQNAVQVAEAVCRLATDRTLLDTLQQRARKRAAGLGWDRSAQAFAEAFEECRVLGRRRFPMKSAIRHYVYRLADAAGYRISRRNRLPHDFDSQTVATIEFVRPYTATSPERINALCEAVRYLSDNSIPGAIVECGVWRGGSVMAAARTLMERGDTSRDLYLFDTFSGMVEPGAFDVTPEGVPAAARFVREARPDGSGSTWCEASVEEVRKAFSLTRYPLERVHYVVGKVEETIPANAPDQIALLRLDTDWYKSTRHELEHLYSRIPTGGVLIVDDYGDWQGARRAVDEFFAERPRPLLNRIDASGRLALVTERPEPDAP